MRNGRDLRNEIVAPALAVRVDRSPDLPNKTRVDVLRSQAECCIAVRSLRLPAFRSSEIVGLKRREMTMVPTPAAARIVPRLG
jgi:hypothetical protein